MSAGKLPEGWADTQLGNIVDYGKANKRVLSDVNDDTWVLELEDIQKESSKLLSKIRASERPFKSTKNSFKKGEVLYGKLRPYLNKVIVAEEDGVCTTEIVPINAEPTCCNKYIFYWLKSSTFQGYVDEVSYGVNMPRLGTADGLKAPLRLAPLAEQKIIAEKLDTLLAQVDSTKARLEQIPQILKRFRQAVLAAAVSGKLTESFRANSNYSIINLCLSKISKEVCYAKSWTQYLLKDCCNIISGNAFKSSDFTEGVGIPVIKISNIQYGQFEIKNQQFLPSNFQCKFNSFEVRAGDILMALTRPITNNTLKVCRYPQGQTAGLLNQRVCKFVFKNNINTNFFELLFQSDYFKLQVEDNLSETLQPNLSPNDLKNFMILLPPLPEQHEIVRRVEQLFAYAETIEKQVNNALARVNNLTQSILAKAFRGELTAQWRAENPDLISGENSAVAILKKIKAERAASGSKKASRKKT